MNVEEAVARRRALGTRGLALAACAALIAVVASSLTGVGLAVATSDMRSSSAAGGSGVGDAAATRKRRLRVTAAAIIALTSELRVSGTVIGASRAQRRRLRVDLQQRASGRWRTRKTVRLRRIVQSDGRFLLRWRRSTRVSGSAAGTAVAATRLGAAVPVVLTVTRGRTAAGAWSAGRRSGTATAAVSAGP